MRSSGLLAFAASFSAATAAVYQGFNYGSTQTDGSIKNQATFEAEFKAAKELTGTSGGFTSARLYTCIQGGTTADPISAIPAAIAQDTTLLLGLWASAGSTIIDNEIAALKAAITQYGDKFTSLVAGISIGSEDLYRITPTGIAAGSNPGADAATLVSYIKKVREALKGTALSSAPIGHVDTWTAWVIGSNADVIANVDWLGVDAYPYFQNTQDNGIESGEGLFFDAYDATAAVSGGKPVWITETGWPVSGKTENKAIPSLQNAKTYWDSVGCAKSFGKINTWWFTLQDSFPTTPNPSFGIVGTTLSSTPLYDLSCSGISSDTPTKATESTSSGASSGSATAVASSSGGSTSASGSAILSVTVTSGASATGTAVVVGTGSAGTGGIVTSTKGANGTAPTSSSPSSSASTTGNAANSATSFHSHIMGGALGAVFVAAALLL